MKFTVTGELAVLIRTIRTQKGVSAKELAVFIDKSPSYVSKLESGDVKNIQKHDLTRIFSFLTGGEDFYEEVLPAVVRVLMSFMPRERLPEQVWLLQYDTTDRPVLVTEEMAADLRKRLEELGMEAEGLAAIMNENFDSELSSAFPANEIIPFEQHGSTRILVRLEMDPKDISRILSGADRHTTYLVIYGISHMLIRLEKFGSVSYKLPPENAVEILRDTSAYLEKYQVHSLIGFSRMLSSRDFISRQVNMVNTFDSVSTELMGAIMEFFQEALKYDTLGTTQALDTFSKSLSWDPAFILKLIKLPFYKMEGLSYYQKKNLIQEIIELLDKYDQMSDFEKKLEIY